MPPLASLMATLALMTTGCDAPRTAPAPPADTTHVQASTARVPDWAADAVWYQIFPERFRNGDPKNDPTRESLEFPIRPPATWAISPWTGDWYARAPWEVTMGDNFYESLGVFDRRYGGDLQGVIDKLDYLRDLGVNALYFNPVFYARSMHKYDGNTYHHVDPYFGPDPAGDLKLMEQETSDPATWHFTAADKLFLKMVEQAHVRGMRVIIDGVFNHTGRDFFAFADLRKNGAKSPYKDWYVVQQFDDPATPENEFKYRGWWGVETLPEFADNAAGTDLHPGPKKYVMDATRRWMDPNGDGNPSDGIDGWRLDVANEVPIGFWADWNAMLRQVNPETYTVTEIWENAADFIERGGFSATMNYHGFAFPTKGWLVDNTAKPSEFARMLDERRKEYDETEQHALQNLMDSHDTDRLASQIVNARHTAYDQPARYDYDVGSRVSPRNDAKYAVRAPNAREREIQRLIGLFQFTYVGAPMIYYGTEAGMWGGDDPDDRMPMVWSDLKYADQTADPLGRKRTPDPVRFDSELHRFYKELYAMRRSSAALRRGDFHVLAADDERNMLSFSRSLEHEAVVVVLNRGDEAQSTRVELPEALRGKYEVLLRTPGAAEPRVQQDAAALLLEVPARAGLVLRRKG